MGTVIVVPLANDVNDEWSEIGPNFRKRAMQAQAIVEAYRSKGETVYVAQAAGTLAGLEDRNTLAELGFTYLATIMTPDGWIVNKNDKHVWGTLAEMQFVVAHAAADARFVWVSQRRHLPRIRFIARFLLPSGIHERSWYEVSGQTKEIPLWRELGSYLPLVATKCGLGRRVAWARRRLHMSYDRA